jgi:hypothetical protein
MHLPPDLPADLKAGLARLAHGVSRKAIAERAAAQSRMYRGGGGSHRIVTEADVLAYAFARLPATYAAAAAAPARRLSRRFRHSKRSPTFISSMPMPRCETWG